MNEWRNELLGVWMPYSEWLPTVGVGIDGRSMERATDFLAGSPCSSP